MAKSKLLPAYDLERSKDHKNERELPIVQGSEESYGLCRARPAKMRRNTT